MMTTPICDFVKEYRNTDALRLHMPAHKGVSLLGYESYDITEISGADSLYEASGIIAKSEQNASSLFGSDTYYSTEGSSQCIRAMVYLIKLLGDSVIIAARNAHKTFITAAALTDSEVKWLRSDGNYLESKIDLAELETALENTDRKNKAVYITSPDYLGNVAPIKEISEICKKHGAILAVDNAHGAYLKFLPESLHPIDLGADICCDSAHKTLPVLTGGAYLHISKNAPYTFKERAKDSLSLFGSTSPSYLILQSLDNANKYIYNGYAERLSEFILSVENIKDLLTAKGFVLSGNEPLKIVLEAKKYGYTGKEISDILEKSNIFSEFSDLDFTVFMVSPETGENGLLRLRDALTSIPKRKSILEAPPKMTDFQASASIREAVFSESEIIDAKDSEGRIFADTNISCPPAVPIIIAGEVISKQTIDAFKYYGIEKCRVIKE